MKLERMKLEPGRKAWVFWQGKVSVVTINEKVDPDLGYYVSYDNGVKKGGIGSSVLDKTYAFPEEKARLLEDIDKEIEYLQMYKSAVIVENKLL
jgi:hypothetical protein